MFGTSFKVCGIIYRSTKGKQIYHSWKAENFGEGTPIFFSQRMSLSELILPPLSPVWKVFQGP